ncbi:MAG: TSCPD domain-containing protein [Clostridia bacterium]|nr:TSCPD domain-containing protein [Clostridia bacterium]
MKHYTYKTVNTCSQLIEFDLEGNTVFNISFLGGCISLEPEEAAELYRLLYKLLGNVK